MRVLTTASLVLSLALFGAACGAKEEGATGESPKGDKPAEGKSAPAFAPQTFSFDERRDADQRPMTVKATVGVPSGWALPPAEGDRAPMALTLIPGGEVKGSVLSMSRLSLSMTCHGMCGRDHFEKNIKGLAEQQLQFAGAGAKVVKDEELKPGVWGLVIESGEGQRKATSIAVSHWADASWPKIFFCNAHLQGEYGDLWEAMYKACAEAEVVLEDPKMPAETLDKEIAQLARCPTDNTLTYTADPEREGEPTTFGEVKVARAFAPRPGSVTVFLANYDLETTRLRDAPLEEGQHLLRVSFEHMNEGEILSGRYPLVEDKEGDNIRGSLGLHIPGGRTLNWNVHRAEGAIEVIARTGSRICGRIDIKGGQRGDISGDFVVDLELGGPR